MRSAIDLVIFFRSSSKRGPRHRSRGTLRRFIPLFFMAMTGYPIIFSAHFAEATYISDFRTTLDPVSENCSPPTAQSEFLTSDDQMTLWMKLDDVRIGDSYTYVWIDPAGEVFHRHSMERLEEKAESCSWSTVKVAGAPAGMRPGNWIVKVLYNGVVAKEIPLFLRASSRLESLNLLQRTQQLPEIPGIIPSVYRLDDTSIPLEIVLRFSAFRSSDLVSLRFRDDRGIVGLEQDLKPDSEGNLETYGTLLTPEQLHPLDATENWQLEIRVNQEVRRVFPLRILTPELPNRSTDLHHLFGDDERNACQNVRTPIETKLLPPMSNLFRDPLPNEWLRMRLVLGALVAGELNEARSIAHNLGLEITLVTDPTDHRAVYSVQSLVPGQGPGFAPILLFRPDADPGLIVEVPHPELDDQVVDFGLELLTSGASLLVIAGADSSTNARPAVRFERPLCELTPRDLEVIPGADVSNAVLNDNSMFHAIHMWAVERAGALGIVPLVVQFHGFDSYSQGPDLAASSRCEYQVMLIGAPGNVTDESPFLSEAQIQLGRYFLKARESFPYEVGVVGAFGEECGGLVSAVSANIQARHNAANGTGFIALYLDEEIRRVPVNAEARQVADAIWSAYRSAWRLPEVGPPRPDEGIRSEEESPRPAAKSLGAGVQVREPLPPHAPRPPKNQASKN